MSTLAPFARRALAFFACLGVLVLLTVPQVRAQQPSVDSVFGGAGLGLAGNVRIIAVQPDGKVLVAGGIRNLVRLNADSSTDDTFNPSFDGPIYAMAAQSNGKAIVAGNFLRVNGKVTSNVVRLNSDGSQDASFTGSPLAPVGPTALAIALQSDGKILVGGYTQTLRAETMTGLVRLNADGSLDTDFHAGVDPAPDSTPHSVNTVLVQSDGRILIGGVFTQVNGVARDGFARLNVDGSMDTGYQPAPGAICPGALQPDDKLLVSGGVTTGEQRPQYNTLVRLNRDGSVDASFQYQGGGFTG